MNDLYNVQLDAVAIDPGWAYSLATSLTIVHVHLVDPDRLQRDHPHADPHLAAGLLTSDLPDLRQLAEAANQIGRCDASLAPTAELRDGQVRITPPRSVTQLHQLVATHLRAAATNTPLPEPAIAGAAAWFDVLLQPALPR